MLVLAISSGGGHWIELLRLTPALDQHQVCYCSVQKEYKQDVGDAQFYVVRDATQWTPFSLAVLAMQVLFLIRRLKPDVIITTGAAPGYFAVRWGKLLGARTIYLDSLANTEKLSKSGQLAGKFSDLWLTQWEDLATDKGPEFAGKVI